VTSFHAGFTLALGLLLTTGQALAFYETPASSGFSPTPGSWLVTNGGVIKNKDGQPSSYWIVPLSFSSMNDPGGPDEGSDLDWSAWVWVSASVSCKIVLVADVSGPDVSFLITSAQDAAPSTGPARLVLGGASGGWVWSGTSTPASPTFRGAYLKCSVPGGAWVGNVQWTY
jgi:hypothetical protein